MRGEYVVEYKGTLLSYSEASVSLLFIALHFISCRHFLQAKVASGGEATYMYFGSVEFGSKSRTIKYW